MNVSESNRTEPAVEADLAVVMDHLISGNPLDPSVVRRVRERSEQATEEIRRRFGTLDVAVELIRETRDEE